VLYLLFRLGQNRYALPASGVEEVLPLLAVSALAGAPPGVAGVVNYRGGAVPVVDLAAMLLGRPARQLFSTRLLILKYPARNGETRRLGCIAEQATEVLRCAPQEFEPAGVELAGAPCLGLVRPDADGLVLLVEVEALLSPPVREALFKDKVREALFKDKVREALFKDKVREALFKDKVRDVLFQDQHP
jgi:chemotaxis-related protein WspB